MISKQNAYQLMAVDFVGAGYPFFIVRGALGFIGRVDGTELLGVSTWQHIAGTHSGTFMRFFANGVQQKNSPNTNIPNVTGSALNLGVNYAGSMDEVRVAAAERTNAWIAFQYQAMEDGLVAFDDPTAITD